MILAAICWTAVLGMLVFIFMLFVDTYKNFPASFSAEKDIPEVFEDLEPEEI